jgi:hypothetical protein
VKQIISEHGGEVEVESEPDRETMFRITLPVHLAKVRVARENGGASTSAGGPNVEVIEVAELAVKGPLLVDE